MLCCEHILACCAFRLTLDKADIEVVDAKDAEDVLLMGALSAKWTNNDAIDKVRHDADNKTSAPRPSARSLQADFGFLAEHGRPCAEVSARGQANKHVRSRDFVEGLRNLDAGAHGSSWQ